jgi:hypothetical protein
MANPNFDDILSTTLDNHRSEFIDNVFSGNPLTYWLKENGRIRMDAGGAKIVAPLMYAKNTTSASYSGWDPLDTTPQDALSAAEYEWRQHAVTVSINGFEEFKNSGEPALINLLDARVQQAEMTAIEDFETMFLGDGSGNSGKDMLGLAALVGDADSDVTAVGGIDCASEGNEFWQSNVTRDTGDLTIGKLNAAYLSVSKAGKDTPDLILSGADLYAAHEALVLPSLRLTDTKLAQAGFDNIAFKRARHVFTDSPAIAATDLYLVNSKYLQLVGGKGRWFVNTPFVKPYNQDARYSHILSVGNLVVTNRARQAKLEDVTVA